MKYLLIVGTWTIRLPAGGEISASVVSSFKDLALEEIGATVIGVQDMATDSLVAQSKDLRLKDRPAYWSAISIQITDWPGDGSGLEGIQGGQ